MLQCAKLSTMAQSISCCNSGINMLQQRTFCTSSWGIKASITKFLRARLWWSSLHPGQLQAAESLSRLEGFLFFYCPEHCVLRPMTSVGSVDVKVL